MGFAPLEQPAFSLPLPLHLPACIQLPLTDFDQGLPVHLSTPTVPPHPQNRARADATDALRAANRRAAEAEARADALQGDAEAMALELQERPTVQEARCGLRKCGLAFISGKGSIPAGFVLTQRTQRASGTVCLKAPGLWNEAIKRACLHPVANCRRLRDEIDRLQRSLASARRKAAAASSDAAVDSDTASVCDAGPGAEAGARAGLAGRPRGARAQMERDRAVARLGLACVEEMPRDALVDAVQVQAGPAFWRQNAFAAVESQRVGGGGRSPVKAMARLA